VRLEQTIHEEFGTERVALISRGECVEIGAFLGPDQKAELARELNRALIDKGLEDALLVREGSWIRPTLEGLAVADGLAGSFRLSPDAVPTLRPAKA
jgi:hypothetical protein